MSHQAQSWVYEWSEAKLGARLVLLSIAYHADRAGDNAWPSVATIAREARMSARQVQRALGTLERLGELEVRRGAGPNGTNLYRIPGVSQPGLPLINPDLAAARPAPRGDRMSPTTICRGGDIPGGEGVTFPAETMPEMSPKESGTVQKEQDGGDARPREDAVKVERLRERLCGIIGADAARNPNFAVGNDIRCWLSAGATEADVESAVRDVMARIPVSPPESFAYFAKAVSRAKAQREAGLPAAPAVAGAGPPKVSFFDRMNAVLERDAEAAPATGAAS